MMLDAGAGLRDPAHGPTTSGCCPSRWLAVSGDGWVPHGVPERGAVARHVGVAHPKHDGQLVARLRMRVTNKHAGG